MFPCYFVCLSPSAVYKLHENKDCFCLVYPRNSGPWHKIKPRAETLQLFTEKKTKKKKRKEEGRKKGLRKASVIFFQCTWLSQMTWVRNLPPVALPKHLVCVLTTMLLHFNEMDSIPLAFQKGLENRCCWTNSSLK